MKSIFTFLLAATTVLAACNNNKPGEERTDTPIQNAVKDVKKQEDELSKLQPLGLEQLKAMIPESLMGAKRTNIEANSSSGAGLAQGEYELNDSTTITLNIYDCGGPAGAGIYSMQYLGLENLQQETDEEYTRAIDFNGGKAFEQCEKATNDCTLSYFAGGRFMVTLESDHVGAEALKQAARGLNIK